MSEPIKLEISSSAADILRGLERFSAAMGFAIARALDDQNQLSIADSALYRAVYGYSINHSNATVSGMTVSSSIGTNVVYAGVHEFGFTGAVQVQAHNRQRMGATVNPKGTSNRVAPRDMPRHPVISFGEAAKRLRVSKSHLNRVVRGERPNARLLARYDALVREFFSSVGSESQKSSAPLGPALGAEPSCRAVS